VTVLIWPYSGPIATWNAHWKVMHMSDWPILNNRTFLKNEAKQKMFLDEIVLLNM
jgi:hypothetical protein